MPFSARNDSDLIPAVEVVAETEGVGVTILTVDIPAFESPSSSVGMGSDDEVEISVLISDDRVRNGFALGSSSESECG